MVDLTRFEELQKIQDEGRFFPILDAMGKLTDMKVKVAGPDSLAQRKAQSAIDAKLTNGRRNGLETSEEVYREWATEKLAASVLGWENLEFEGKPLECSPENVMKMLTSFPVFHNQVAFYASDRSLFAPDEPGEKVKTKEAS